MKSLVIEGRVDVLDAAKLALMLEGAGIPATSKSDLVNKAFALSVRSLTGDKEVEAVQSVEDAVIVLRERNLLYEAGSRKMRTTVRALQIEHLTAQDVNAALMIKSRTTKHGEAPISNDELVRITLEELRRRVSEQASGGNTGGSEGDNQEGKEEPPDQS